MNDNVIVNQTIAMLSYRMQIENSRSKNNVFIKQIGDPYPHKDEKRAR